MLHTPVKLTTISLRQHIYVPELRILKVNRQTRVGQVQGKDSTLPYHKIFRESIRLEPSETQGWTSGGQPRDRIISHLQVLLQTAALARTAYIHAKNSTIQLI